MPAATDPCAAAGCAGGITTGQPDTDALAVWFAGLVAAEGCFTVTKRGRQVFMFQLGLGAVDTVSCVALHDFLGVGNLVRSARRRPHYDDEIALQVRRLADLVGVVIPFMDEHLPPSSKRLQYTVWRAELLDHWEHRSKRRACTVEGCDTPQRARGLCRRHYYAAFGL